MYKVLVVDDEEPARETLRYLIDWEKTSFRISGFAKNGKEALDEYNVQRPNLIITDIQMPVMDGLELIKKIRQENASQKFVILSCHENFNYAKEAIRYGVSDYLLKDLLTSEDLYCLLSKIENDITSENMLKLNDKTYKLYSSLSFDENFYRDECRNIALQGIISNSLNDESLADYVREFSLSFFTKYYSVLCITIDDYTKLVGKLGRIQEKHKIHEIMGIIKGVLDEFNSGECFYDGSGTFIAIAGIYNTSSELYYISSCNSIANRIHTNLVKLNDITVTIGISSCLTNLKNIKSKYNEAIEVVKYRIFLGKGRTILYNVKYLKSVSLDPTELDNILGDIRNDLDRGEIGRIKGLIKSIYSDEERGFIQYNYLSYVNSQMLGIVVEFCRKNSIDYSMVFGGAKIPVEKLEEFETVEEMSNWFYDIMLKIMNFNALGTASAYSKHVKDAIKYIKDNYNSKLGLSHLSYELGVNKAYLCRIFKNETGDNLTDYINRMRIEKAKQLMVATNYKVYEIAEKVGFTNIQHFNNSFKKVTGINPLKFRNDSTISSI